MKFHIIIIIFTAFFVSACELSLSSQVNKLIYPADYYFVLDSEPLTEIVNLGYGKEYRINAQGNVVYVMVFDYSGFANAEDYTLYTVSSAGTLIGLQKLTNLESFIGTGLSTNALNKHFTIKNSLLYYFEKDTLVIYNITNDSQVLNMSGLSDVYIHDNREIFLLSNQTEFYHFDVDPGMNLNTNFAVTNGAGVGSFWQTLIGDDTGIFVRRIYPVDNNIQCTRYDMAGNIRSSFTTVDEIYDYIDGVSAEYLGKGAYRTFDNAGIISLSYGFTKGEVDRYELEFDQVDFDTSGKAGYILADRYGDLRVYHFQAAQ